MLLHNYMICMWRIFSPTHQVTPKSDQFWFCSEFLQPAAASDQQQTRSAFLNVDPFSRHWLINQQLVTQLMPKCFPVSSVCSFHVAARRSSNCLALTVLMGYCRHGEFRVVCPRWRGHDPGWHRRADWPPNTFTRCSTVSCACSSVQRPEHQHSFAPCPGDRGI